MNPPYMRRVKADDIDLSFRSMENNKKGMRFEAGCVSLAFQPQQSNPYLNTCVLCLYSTERHEERTLAHLGIEESLTSI